MAAPLEPSIVLPSMRLALERSRKIASLPCAASALFLMRVSRALFVSQTAWSLAWISLLRI